MSLRILPACIVTALLASAAHAQAPDRPAPPTEASALDGLVSLKFHSPLKTLLDSISGPSDLCFVARQTLQREYVTGLFPQATIQDVLTRTLGAQGLLLRQVGDSHTYVVLLADESATPDPAVQGPAWDKRVALHLNDTALPAFLAALTKQTGLRFSVSDDLKDEKLCTHMSDATAREVLDLLLIGKGLTYRKNAHTGVYRLFRRPDTIRNR